MILFILNKYFKKIALFFLINKIFFFNYLYKYIRFLFFVWNTNLNKFLFYINLFFLKILQSHVLLLWTTKTESKAQKICIDLCVCWAHRHTTSVRGPFVFFFLFFFFSFLRPPPLLFPHFDSVFDKHLITVYIV